LGTLFFGLFVHGVAFPMEDWCEEDVKKNLANVEKETETLFESINNLLIEKEELVKKLSTQKKLYGVGDLNKSVDEKSCYIQFLEDKIESLKSDQKLNSDFKKIVCFLDLIGEKNKKNSKKKKKKTVKKKVVKKKFPKKKRKVFCKNQGATRKHREASDETKKEIRLLLKKIKQSWSNDEK
jgi:hypothetical protein